MKNKDTNNEAREGMSEWAENIQQDVFNHWKENHPDYQPGVKTFYGPVFKNPRILFIGYQPGGSKFGPLREQFEEGNFSLPDEHEYLTEMWGLAKNMRNKLFKNEHHLLKNSIALNHIFYRAESISDFKSLPDEKRREMKSYSIAQTTKIVDTLNPDNIFLFGMATWNNMQDEYGFQTDYEVDRIGYQHWQKLVRFSKTSSPQYIGLVHPSPGNHGPQQ